MLIASGSSGRQVSSIAEKLVKTLKDAGIKGARVEGLPAGDWVVVDAIWVIAHIFRPEIRELYDLEAMWNIGGRRKPAPRKRKTEL